VAVQVNTKVGQCRELQTPALGKKSLEFKNQGNPASIALQPSRGTATQVTQAVAKREFDGSNKGFPSYGKGRISIICPMFRIPQSRKYL
jgi:hypothetical protein